MEILKILNDIPKTDNSFHLDMYNSILINPTLLGEKLMNIKDMDDNTLYTFVLNNYALILDYIFNNNNRKEYMSIFLNERFLENLCKIAEIHDLDIVHRNNCNKIIYEALRYNKTKTETRKALLIKLGKIINKTKVSILMGYGISEGMAILLITSLNYTPDMWLNVKHFNHILIKCDPPITDEQTLVSIYEKTFERMTPLVIGIMLDTEHDDLLSVEQEVDSLISLVILDLLNSMTSPDIKTILLEYTKTYQELGLPCRFSMRALSSDYIRISNVVNNLHHEGILVP